MDRGHKLTKTVNFENEFKSTQNFDIYFGVNKNCLLNGLLKLDALNIFDEKSLRIIGIAPDVCVW